MLQKTQGIVLNSIKYGETSLIVRMYTEQFGKQSYIFNGVRKPKPSFSPSHFQLLNVLDLVVYHKEDKDLHRVKELTCPQLILDIPSHPIKRSLVIFIAEVLENSVIEEEGNPAQFEFIKQSIYLLDSWKGKLGNYHIIFLLQLSKYLGIRPHLFPVQNTIYDFREGHYTNTIPFHQDSFNVNEVSFLAELLSLDIELALDLTSQKSLRKAVLEKLLSYYSYHLHYFSGIKSPEVLESVMSA